MNYARAQRARNPLVEIREGAERKGEDGWKVGEEGRCGPSDAT